MSLKADLESLQGIAKERTVRTQTIEYDLETLVKKIEKGLINLNPDYQRKHRWDVEKSSKLIESLILNIPIPTIYLSYDVDVDTPDDGARFSVIDGQQRLTAIVLFFQNKYALKGLKLLEKLNGCYYRDLPDFLYRRLEERTIKCLRIDSTVDPQVKYDIFERLNSGSVKLEAHELRNAVYRGAFNEACKKLAENADFRSLLQVPSKPELTSQHSKVKKMEDVELVVRFAALRNDEYSTYRKSKDKQFKDFLSERLEKLNELDSKAIEAFSTRFAEVVKFILDKFGKMAFAKFKFENGSFRKQSNFNAAVYDALIIAVDAEWAKLQGLSSDEMKRRFHELFKNKDFHESVSGSILDSTKVTTRINMAREAFKR